MKRIISQILILTFLCTLLSFPTASFASSESYILTAFDSGYVYKNNPNTSYSQNTLVIDKGAYRVSFLKYDLSSIKTKIKATDTFSLSLIVWELVNVAADSKFKVSLLPASCENWNSTELTYNNATELLASSGGELVTTADITKKTYNIEFSAADILNHLNSDTDDSVIALKIESVGTGGCTFRKSGYQTSTQLTFTHTVNASDVVDEVYNSLTEDVLTSEDIDSITSNLNLPLSGDGGTTIKWESSNEAVIDPQSGSVSRPRLGEDDASVRLTATIKNGDASREKTFDFVVKASMRAPESMLLSTEIYPDIQTMVNGGSDYKDTAYNGNSLIVDKGTRMVFMKFDFSNYEDVYKTIDSVKFHFGTGGDCEPESNENLTLCVLPDSMEEYVTNSLTWSIAKTQGMTDYVGDGVYTLSDLKNAQKYTTASFLEDVQKNFAENPSNKTFAIKLVETTGNGYTVYNSSLGSYMYKPRLLVGYSIPDYQKDARLLKIPTIIDGDMELPSEGIFGSPITWESSNENLIGSDGTAMVDTADEDYTKEDLTSVLKATVHEDDKTETKEFTVRVRRKGVADAIADTYVTSDANYSDDDEIVLNAKTGNVGFLSFDLTDYYEYAQAGRKIVLKLYGSNTSSDKLTVIPITDASLKSADINKLSFNDISSYTGEALECIQNENGHYIFDVTEYVWEQSDKKALFVLKCNEGKIDLFSSSNLCKEPKLVISPIEYTNEFGVQVAKDDLDFADISSDDKTTVRKNLILPQKGRYDTDITWSVVPEGAVDVLTGELSRGTSDTAVTLTAHITKGGQSLTKDFAFTMIKSETDTEYAQYLLDTLTLPANILTSDISLPGETMPDGAVVSWQSSEDFEAKIDGFDLKITRPNSNHLPVVLTATINYNGVTLTKDFPITLLRSQNKNLLSYKLVTQGDANAQYAVDDSVETVWTVEDSETVYNMGSNQLISGFTVIPSQNDVSGFEIYISADALVWEKIYSGTNLKADTAGSFTPDIAAYGRYVKFIFPAGSKLAYIGAYSAVQTQEDEAFSGVTVPNEAKTNFTLPSVTGSGSAIKWTSSSAVINIDGYTAQVKQGTSDTMVTLTATLTDGTQKTYVVLVPKKKENSSGGGGSSGGGSSGGGSSYVNSSYPSVPAVSSPTAPQPDSYFTDLGDASWAVKYINSLYSKNIINGVGGTSFAPNNSLKREEAAKIIASALGITADGSSDGFDDVSSDAWYYPYVMAMKSSGIINGTGDGNFGVGMSITRQDAFCMVARAIDKEYKEDYVLEFNDKESIAPYATESIGKLYSLGIVNGDTNGNINPSHTITRAEFSKVIYMALEILGK